MTEKSIPRQFLEATALKPGAASVQQAEGWSAKPAPAGGKVFSLPEPGLLPDRHVNFLEVVELRSTVRQYLEEELSMEELSYLLWCTQGVKMTFPNGDSRRNVPSAGGRHALETYLYVQRVRGLVPGRYRFLPLEHALLFEAAREDVEEAFLAGFKAANMVKNSAVTFLWTAVSGRMTAKFGPRGYRYLFLDAGHVCENLYLAAQTINIGVCAVGAFFDEELNAALGLDGESEFAIYGATAGKI